MTDGPIMDAFDGDELDRILAKRTIWPWREVGDDHHQITLDRLSAVSQYLYDTMNGDADSTSDERPPDPLPALAMERVRAAQAAIDAAIKAGQRTRRRTLGYELVLVERWSEPPTEPKPFDKRDYPMAFPATADIFRAKDDAYVESKRAPGEREFTPEERADILARRDEPPTDPARTCDGCAERKAGCVYENGDPNGATLCPDCAADEPPTEEDAVTPEPAPEIVMDANGHYWRRYDDMLSMVPTTTANENTEIVAVYQRVRSAAFSLLDVSWKGEQPTTDDFPRSRSLDELPTEAPLAERWPDGSVHDYRCQGECVRCWGAEVCGMVGQSCIPCTGSCVEKTGAVPPPAEPPKACETREDAPMEIKPDVRNAYYMPAGCPSCGRVRLEIYVDGQDDNERCVGVRCEKCLSTWLFDPEKTSGWWGEFAEDDPLNPQPPTNDPFSGDRGSGIDGGTA